MEKKTLYLPHELIVEILLRLPVKSLICFKCVCKSWYSLISNPNFSNSHFQLTAATHTRRIMSISVSPPKICSIDFETSFTYDHASFNVNFWLPQSNFPVEIKGSCRGFIFLYCRPYIYLWNPSSGFKKQIHVSPFDTKLAPELSNDSDHIYGFGYDQSRDDYVVVVLSHEPTEENPFSSHLEFFSNRDNKWKEIEGTHFPYFSPQTEGGLFFNGAIHWLAFRPDIKIDVIVTFDLSDRKLFEMPLPEYFHQEVPFAQGLWVFGEFFSLYAQDFNNRTIEIWVMKEYKLNSSWTKTLVFDADNYFLNFHFTPICSTNNGDIIGTIPGSRLVKYNDKGQLLEFRTFRNGPSEIVLYTETLLSLPGNNEQDYKLVE
ncbi:F-box/kelch-repeat protein [Trifolium repens]|nr:F-box/kelch-repeat protein [Trifolium repens]